MTQIKIPQYIPEFTEREIAYLTGRIFKKKPFERISKKANYYIRLLLAIIKNKSQSDWVSINCTELGRIFKSQQMASDVLKFCIDNKLIDCCNFYMPNEISRRYKINNNFLILSIIHSNGLNLAS